MAAEQSSGAVLQRIWERFARDYAATHGSKPSKRLISQTYFDADEHQLARWTSRTRKAWRFPLARLQELRVALEANQQEIDDLATARLTELSADSLESEAVVAATWVAGFLERHSLNDDEEALLTAYRAARANRVLGFYRTGSLTEELAASMDKMLAEHEASHFEDSHDDSDFDTAEVAALRRDVLAMMAKSASKGTLAPRKSALVRARTETTQLLKRLRELKALR
jgi:hypothetical protein